MKQTTLTLAMTTGLSVLLLSTSPAQDAVSSADRIVVTGEEVVEKTELSASPAAAPASVTVLKYTEEQKRNTRDYSDLLRTVTGVSANNFDQGGVGYGITLRGFSEISNGGDVAYSIDGVPVNFPGHVSDGGYGDLFPLIPELVDSFVLVRGPFDVRFGAFDLAGSLAITTQDHPTSGLELSIGNFDYERGLLVYGLGSGPVSGYGSVLSSNLGGYRDNGDFRQFNTFDKIVFPMLDGTGSFRVQVYNSDFGSSGYLNRGLLEAGVLQPTDAINTTDGGSTALQNFVFNYKEKSEQPLNVTAYFVHENFKRWRDFSTEVPVDPDLPGQRLQADYRFVLGGSAEKYFIWELPCNMGLGLLVGAGLRYDTVDSEQFSTIRRDPVAPLEDVNFTRTNPFGYLQVDFKPFPWMKVTSGFRYDHFNDEIQDNIRGSNTSPSFDFLGPRAGISITPVKGLDFFGNYGQGFRPANPITELNLDAGLQASENETIEVGLQYNSPDGMWHFLFDAYKTTFTNELGSQPDPLPPIALGPSERNGFDVETRVRLYQHGGSSFDIFGNFSAVDGELVGRTGGTNIPDIPDFIGTYGFDLAVPLPNENSPHVITLSAKQRWEGPKPLNSTRSEATKVYSRVDVRLTYTNTNWRGFSVFLNMIAYPDRRYEETAFFTGPTIVAPKAPFTVQGGMFVPF